MGLYSTNRVVQLATSNYMGESAIDFEHIDTDESAPNLLESSIMLHEADQQMFDTLIGLDFVEAHNEQAMLEDSNANDDNDVIDADYTELDDDGNPKDTAKSSATSSDANKAVSKNIFQKIVDIIQKAIEVVKNAIKTAINKVREFINNTSNKVVAARLKKYDWSKFKEFKVKYNPVAMEDYTTARAIKKITELKTLVSSVDINVVSPKYLERKIKDITDYTKIANDNRDYIKKTDKEFRITANMAKEAVDIISTADKTISDLNKAGNEATMALLKLKQRAGKPKKDDAKSANNLYLFATKASKAVVKLVQSSINEHVAMIKVARSIAFKIGRGKAEASDNAKASNANNAKTNTTNNNESAYDSFVGSISDIYVENYFADLFD